MNPAPGWYPDPRPTHKGLQAYWDGQRWHLEATKLTETAEWVAIIAGVVAAMVLGAIFPPAIVMILGIWIWWHFYDKAKKKRAIRDAQWYREHGQPPSEWEREWAKFSPAEKEQFLADIGFEEFRRKGKWPS